MTEWLYPSGALIFVALVALLWRQTLTLGKLAGINTRAQDRERRDLHHMIQRLLEKRDANDGLEMTRIHARERAEQMRLDAKVEENAERPPAAPEKPQDEHCSADEYEN